MAQKNKKTEIIESAITIFARDGFDYPSMEYIASQAAVSKRTLYKHFSSKDDLLQEIIPYFINKANSSIVIELSDDKTPRSHLVEIIEQKLKIILEQSNLKLTRILIGEVLKENNSISSTLDNVFKNETVTHDWILELQDKGFFRMDKSAAELTTKLNDIIHGLVLFPLLLRERERSPGDAKLIADLFLIFACDE